MHTVGINGIIVLIEQRKVRCKAKEKIMSAALDYLEKLIREGWEYPDAEYKAACKFGVSADELRADYDRQ